jgi:type IV pilus assembly protein PilQ
MNDTTPNQRPTFFVPPLSVYVLCAMLAASAIGASPGAIANARAGEGASENADTREVSVTGYGSVDLAVQETDLAHVLQMLALQSKKNIITSRSVSATVTANLFDVTFYEALDSILRVNGYGYIEEGNFIYVYTLTELEEIERARRRTESRIFELEHLSSVDAFEFLQPLLSADGRASHRGEVTRGFRPDISDGGADEYAFAARIVVNDYPENIQQISTLLRELDTPPQQVLVEATVLRTTLNEDTAFGIDFSIVGNIDIRSLTNPLTAAQDLILGTGRDTLVVTEQNNQITTTEIPHQQPKRAVGIQSTVGRTAEAGGFKVGVIRDDFAVFMRLLDEVTDTTVLARPKIMALNRQRAQVHVGERVAYRTTTQTETAATQSVEFYDTGIVLAFRPFISRDGMIRMELQPQVSFAVLREMGDGEQVPDVFTNELTTNVRIRDGETLVLGGLFQEEVSNIRRQVPFLGDVPIIGAAFRGHDDGVRRSEIIFLITPSIVRDETLWEIGRDTLSYSDAVRVGARAGLLPFSREKVTAGYNTQAVEAWNRGDVRMSQYYINNSLRLNANQPEMIRLRAKVTGEPVHPHEPGILERVLRKELGTHGWQPSAMVPVSRGGQLAGSEQSTASSEQPFTDDSSELTDVAEASPDPVTGPLTDFEPSTVQGPAWMWWRKADVSSADGIAGVPINDDR